MVEEFKRKGMYAHELNQKMRWAENANRL